MAWYDFECTKCGHIDELVMSISDSEKDQICSKCGEPSKKIISASNFVLKGGCGGFHCKDYPKTGKS